MDAEPFEQYKWVCTSSKISGSVEPGPRVGHVCVPIVMPEDRCTKVLLIGGADPDGVHNDMYIFDPAFYSWTRIQCTNLTGRYEFGTFVRNDLTEGQVVYIFGGADEHGNRNDIQSSALAALETGCSWKYTQYKGEAPSPRTQHNAVSMEDCLVVFGGGMQASNPVDDTNTYVFRAADSTWTKLKTSNPPTRRHGHVAVNGGGKIYLHGGMAGSVFYDDLHVLDLTTGIWSKVVQEAYRPSARASHGRTVHAGRMYIFGGLGHSLQALGDFWTYDIGKNKWSEIKNTGAFPSPRLDFALCLFERSREAAAGHEKSAFIFIHGGMNSGGDVFNDTYLCRL